MSLGAAIATFCSSNKAGSIPLFTQHLNTNPNDYTALMWRGRAYSIIGEVAKAIADFVKAASVTGAPRKDLAQAECEFLSENTNQGIAILYSVVKNYPDCAEAWGRLGECLSCVKNPDAAFEYLNKAVNLGKSNGETSEPWYPWANNHLGDICYADGRIDLSSEYYNEATRACSSLTVAHLGSSRCDILRDNTAQAKDSFEVAKKLNPTLVKWANFDDFRSDVVIESKGRAQASGAVRKSGAGGGGGRSSGGGGGGGRDKKGGDGSGGESDSDEDRGRKGIRTRGQIDGQTAQLIADAMKKLKKEAPAIKKFEGRKYYQSKDGEYWYVKDTAGHAGALLKKYKDRRSTLEFEGSMTIDKAGNLVDIDPGKKHESNKIPVIEKSKMKTCK